MKIFKTLSVVVLVATFGFAHFSAHAAEVNKLNQSHVVYTHSFDALEAALAKKVFVSTENSQARKGLPGQPVMKIELVGDTSIELSDEELLDRISI